MKKAVYFLISLCMATSYTYSMYQAKALMLYELILPWIGESEMVKKAIQDAEESKESKELINKKSGAKAVLDPYKQEVTLSYKSSNKTVTYCYFLSSIDETLSALPFETAQNNGAEEQSLCIIS